MKSVNFFLNFLLMMMMMTNRYTFIFHTPISMMDVVEYFLQWCTETKKKFFIHIYMQWKKFSTWICKQNKNWMKGINKHTHTDSERESIRMNEFLTHTHIFNIRIYSVILNEWNKNQRKKIWSFWWHKWMSNEFFFLNSWIRFSDIDYYEKKKEHRREKFQKLFTNFFWPQFFFFVINFFSSFCHNPMTLTKKKSSLKNELFT